MPKKIMPEQAQDITLSVSEARGYFEMSTSLWPLWRRIMKLEAEEAFLERAERLFIKRVAGRSSRLMKAGRGKWHVASICSRLVTGERKGEYQLVKREGQLVLVGATRYDHAAGSSSFSLPDRYRDSLPGVSSSVNFDVFPFKEGNGRVITIDPESGLESDIPIENAYTV
jgi:hypothetical protein